MLDECISAPIGFGCGPFLDGGCLVVDHLIIVAPIFVFGPCFVMQCLVSFLTSNQSSLRKRELVTKL